MAMDARFEDGGEEPLRLRAEDADDLSVVSSLVQDAVFPAEEMAWRKNSRSFAILLNRFRWEDRNAAERRGRPVERVRAILEISDVLNVQSQGVDPRVRDTVLSLLSIGFEPGEDGVGRVELTLAGDGLIGIDVEYMNISLTDVTRPYIAPSRSVPGHDS